MTEDPSIDFGTMFRQAREKRGVSLQQVAAVTRISASVLDAIERNDVSKLPGGIFSRAFVRSYAREIGLDPEMAIERFTTQFPDESGKEQLPSARDAEDIEAYESGRRVAVTVLQLLGLSIVVIIALWFVLNSGSCRKTPAAAPSTVSAPAPSTPAPVVPPPVTPATPPPAEEPVGATKNLPTGEPVPAPSQLTIAAQAQCWLRVTVDKVVVFNREMRAGERLAYQASTSVTLSAGNAGGLVLTINGKPARPLGTAGQVVTTTITLETLASFLQ
jgi:cytoskeletal protein RodZ